MDFWLSEGSGKSTATQSRTRRDGRSSPRVSLAPQSAAGCFSGSRIRSLTAAHWHDAVYLMSGKTIVGGLIGGLFAVEWVKRQIGEKSSTGDLFAAPIALGVAIGRIGCFLGGLPDGTYGTPTSLPWGVDFGDGIPRHPTQLYESDFCHWAFSFSAANDEAPASQRRHFQSIHGGCT